MYRMTDLVPASVRSPRAAAEEEVLILSTGPMKKQTEKDGGDGYWIPDVSMQADGSWSPRLFTAYWKYAWIHGGYLSTGYGARPVVRLKENTLVELKNNIYKLSTGR